MDPEPIPFAYELVGCVNGVQAALRIGGSVTHNEVRFETRGASPEEPVLWDEQVLVLAAIDPVVLVSLDPDTVRRNAAPEIFRVESGLFDEGEKPVGRFVLVGCWSAEEERIGIRAQVVEGWLNLEPMERVTNVGLSSPMSVLSTEKERVVAMRTWAVRTSRGNSYCGTSVSGGSSLAFDREVQDQVLRLLWTGVSGGEVSAGRASRAYRVAVEGCGHPQR